MITAQEYQARRNNLALRLPADSVALIPAAGEVLRNGDAHYRFRQNSDFYYLTGFDEPEALLVISSGLDSQSILFNRPRNLEQEQWTGRRLGQDDACKILAVDAAYPLDELEIKLPELLAGKPAIYYHIGQDEALERHIRFAWQVVKAKVRQGVNAPDTFCDLAGILGEMRLFKHSDEINAMRQAAKITVAAHQRAMQACRRARFEYELEAELLYEFTRQGCRNVAYDSIVAGGENACVLHYTANDKPLTPGDLVLIDAGGEFGNYAADVTRTFPINGSFSAEQKLIYDLVLRAQKAGIDCVRPGSLWGDIQRAVVNVLTSGLVDLGILRGNVDELIATGAYKPFYMHNSGHWLGLDVHDVGLYKKEGQWRALEPNMVLTVEPGLYISAGLEGVDKRWWNIGVRIEDDIRVTEEGHENLTADLAVEIEDIEALVRG